MTRCRRYRSPRRGFLVLDVVGGLMLMLVTVVLLAGITGRSRIAARRLADDRAATRLAETTLLRLAADGSATIDDAVHVTPLDTAAPPGLRWVNATSNLNGRRATIVGLVQVPTAATAPTTTTTMTTTTKTGGAP